MSGGGLEGFLAEEQLPQSFRLTLDEVCGPLADRALDWRADFGRTAIVGLCGAQGSGKSTIARATVQLLAQSGRKAVALSLDDFYLSREARGWLAKNVGSSGLFAACAGLMLLWFVVAWPMRAPRAVKSADEVLASEAQAT